MSGGPNKAPAKPLTLGLAGCGKMGSAMVRAWMQSPFVAHIDILDPSALPADLEQHPKLKGFKSGISFMDCAEHWDGLVLAVKPQIMDEFCPAIAPVLPEDVPILSIVTGKTLGYYTKQFGKDQPIVRAMPNTPAAIGKGMTVACASPALHDTEKTEAHFLLSCLGKVEWVEDETLMDAVTAVSGSGPAYVFYLLEALAQAGTKAGLKPDFAMALARQTVIGAAALIEADETPAAKLRENVTSPNGTTAAALSVLMNGTWQDLLTEAVAAAAKRAKELSR